MTTIKSSSEKSRFLSIYRSAVKGQTSFAIIAGILFLLLIPLIYFVGVENPAYYGYVEPAERALYYARMGYFQDGIYLADVHAGFVLAALLLLTLVIALIQNAYMHSKKMTDLYHSLPVKRSTLLGANLLASMTAILGPFLVAYLVTLAGQLIRYSAYIPDYGQYLGYILLDLVNAVVLVAVIYLFTTFVATCVGTVFDNFALTGVLGILPPAIFLICTGIWSVMTYGSDVNFDYILMLSPFTFAFQRFMDLNSHMNTAEYMAGYARAFLHIGIWAAIGAGLYFAAAACYRRRKSEIAEQPQPGGVLQIIAKCFGAFCGGALFLAIFYYQESLVVWVIAILAGSLLIGAIGELILSRGVRSLKKNLKWLLAAGVLCVLVLLGSVYDFFGYTTRVPNPDKVAVAYVSYRGRFSDLSDRTYSWETYPGSYSTYGSTKLEASGDIALLTDFHQDLVKNKPPRRFETDNDDAYTYHYTTIEYHLKDGRVLTRSFERVHMDSLRVLAALEAQEGFIRENHQIFRLGDSMKSQDDPDRAMPMEAALSNSFGGESRPLGLTGDELGRLVEAARQDMLAEPLEEILEPSAPAVAYLEILYRTVNRESDTAPSRCVVVVGAGYVNTLAVLDSLGALDSLDNAPEIDQIFLSPAPYEVGSVNRVRVLTPGSKYMMGDIVDNTSLDYYVHTEDAALIRQAVSVGRSQMYCGGDSLIEYDAVVIACYKDGKWVGARLARYNSLPQTLQRQLDERYGETRDTIVATPAHAIDIELDDAPYDGGASSVSPSALAVGI